MILLVLLMYYCSFFVLFVPFLNFQEEESASCSFGTFGEEKVFDCNERKAFFVYLSKIQHDSRFDESRSLLERTPSQCKSPLFANLPHFTCHVHLPVG